jgi:diguanylate cyclase (GGDEF)-like protein/putative nucleotidyltransferase with HDIG domain
MKQIARRLTGWWFSTLVPEHGPLTTIDAREHLRKRRLLSIMLLVYLMQSPMGLLSGPNKIANGVFPLILLAALWLNKRGYLRSASLCFLLSAFFAMALELISQSSLLPIFCFSMWSSLLILPVVAGLLLPSWGPLVMTAIGMLFMCWFVLIEFRDPIIFFAESGSTVGKPSGTGVLLFFLLFTCIMLLAIGGFTALSTAITKKALVQADRATELELAYATIAQQALTDGLTGLPNHRALMEQLEKEIERARRHKRPFSLLFFDADRFKHINDTYGHAVGDTVLCQLGERARSILRREDTIGRFGGEEFVVLLPESGIAEATEIAERIRAAVATCPIITPDASDAITATVSIGLATYPSDGETDEILLTNADEAMYIAKRMGRNQVRTAAEACQMSADVELMALLQEAKQQDDTQRDDVTLECLREASTLKISSSLLNLLNRRDKNMSAHAYAVSDIATALAQKMELDEKQVARIGMAALLHDIGKVALPDTLLQKTDLLSSEMGLLSEHAELGAQVLEASPFMSDLVPAVRHHHERWDGNGYPDQLAGVKIPLAARIIAVAEAYDAMQREYPYQQPCSAEKALIEIQQHAGDQFDPLVVHTLSAVLTEQQKRVQAPLSIG